MIGQKMSREACPIPPGLTGWGLVVGVKIDSVDLLTTFSRSTNRLSLMGRHSKANDNIVLHAHILGVGM